MFQYFQIFFYMLLTVLQLLADWPASLMKTIFKSHKIFFAVVQIFLYIDVDGNECECAGVRLRRGQAGGGHGRVLPPRLQRSHRDMERDAARGEEHWTALHLI